MALNAAELLARIKQRKKELNGKKEWETWDCNPSNKIYHPEQVIDATEPSTLYLTKDEKKRQRRNKREEESSQLRERIKLGIEAPPPPKVKLSNVGNVYGPKYVKDPTYYEGIAREAEKKRRKLHEEMNETRRLMAKQNRPFLEAQKLQQHRNESLYCIAAKFPSPLSNKSQYIVDYTSKKFGCTGVALLSADDAILIIETGEPEALKYEKLALKLGADICWRGPLPKPNFKRWSVHNLPDRNKFLELHGVESMI